MGQAADHRLARVVAGIPLLLPGMHPHGDRAGQPDDLFATARSRPTCLRALAVQALGHVVLDHQVPRDYAAFLEQRVEINYFAAALLIPERAR